MSITRREMASSLGLGLMAAAVAPQVSGAEAGDSHPMTVPEPLQDPALKYPRPPFPIEIQSWPGLVSKMHPRPDHGETSYRGSRKLQGRKALITGGDSGIGRAAAIAYAREGADVAINYLAVEESDAQEVVRLIEAEGRTAVAISGDIRNEDFCQKLVTEAAERLGGLDIVVSNAARQRACPSLADLSSVEFDWTMKTNVYAPFWLIKAALPHLKAGSAIIATASEQAFNPHQYLVDYAMSKAATVSLVKSLAKQFAPQGIRVNGVAPGPFWTPLQVSGGAPDDWVSSYGQGTFLGRPGQPAELGPVYVLLAANEGSYLTGQIIGATGGSGFP